MSQPDVGSLCNLSSSYPYLQGVEISTQAQYDAGLQKIWSGLPGHRCAPVAFDASNEVMSSPFADGLSTSFVVRFGMPRPFHRAMVGHLAAVPDTIFNDGVHLPVLLYPIQNVSDDPGGGHLRYKSFTSQTNIGEHVEYRLDQDNVSTTFSSIIEPLAIRLTPAFYSDTTTTDAHVVMGYVGEGNVDGTGACDRILTVDKFRAATEHAPFIDDDRGLTRCGTSTNNTLDVTGSYYARFAGGKLIDVYYPDSSELVTPIASRTAFESRLRDSSGTHLVSGTFRFNVTAFSAGALSELTYDGVLVSRVKSLRTSELQPVIFGRQTEAFDDTRYARNVPPPASEDASLLSVMSMMTGSTDNYIRYDEVSATCGWYYDNNMSVGTDSLAFGGMTY